MSKSDRYIFNLHSACLMVMPGFDIDWTKLEPEKHRKHPKSLSFFLSFFCLVHHRCVNIILPFTQPRLSLGGVRLAWIQRFLLNRFYCLASHKRNFKMWEIFLLYPLYKNAIIFFSHLSLPITSLQFRYGGFCCINFLMLYMNKYGAGGGLPLI